MQGRRRAIETDIGGDDFFGGQRIKGTQIRALMQEPALDNGAHKIRLIF
jgi:hypothetical protein